MQSEKKTRKLCHLKQHRWTHLLSHYGKPVTRRHILYELYMWDQIHREDVLYSVMPVEGTNSGYTEYNFNIDLHKKYN